MTQTTTAGVNYPALALRGLVAFPDMMLTVDVGRKKSVQALNFAMEQNSPIYLITQKNIASEQPENGDLYSVGCVCKVRQVLTLPDGSVKALVSGLYRARHTSFDDNGRYYTAEVVRLDDKPLKNRPVYIESLIRRIRASFETYLEVSDQRKPLVPLRFYRL